MPVGCFVGSGSEGMQQPEVTAKVIELTRKNAADVTVLYIGTATYDLPMPKINQTKCLQEAGCAITDIICGKDEQWEIAEKLESADVIIISGGNTLYAMNYWRALGLPALVKKAADRGCVLTGGSAGAICWFDAGHSDSADPDTYKARMIADASASSGTLKDESSTLEEGHEAKKWEYIRVKCFGFLPGLVCPHADRTQSNGVLRTMDFDQMLLRHRGERGICIDHFAALIVDGDQYSVLSMFGRAGNANPTVYIKEVAADGMTIETKPVPSTGLCSDLFKVASEIVEDTRCDACAASNPIF
jgi:dipeptidase E